MIRSLKFILLLTYLLDMDKKSLEFHIKSQDYFGSLSTILNLIKQILDSKENVIISDKVIKDLLYLQENCTINKK